MYFLQLYNDILQPEAANTPELLAQHNIIYLEKGHLKVNGHTFAEGASTYFEDYANLNAGGEETMIWRWVVTKNSRPLVLLRGDGIESILRMTREVKMFELVPTSKWLFRLDCIIDHEGSTGLHSHPGSGIRAMLKGSMRVASKTGESSCNTKHGDVWYEEGAYPCTSTSEPGIKSTFLRGMILPPAFADHPDTAKLLENNVIKSSWKGMNQQVIMLR